MHSRHNSRSNQKFQFKPHRSPIQSCPTPSRSNTHLFPLTTPCPPPLANPLPIIS